MKQKKWFFVLSLLFVFLLSFTILIFKGLPERIIINSLKISKEGFSFSNIKGNLESGLIIEDFSFKNNKIKIKAKRVFLKASRIPLLFKIFKINELNLEDGEIEIFDKLDSKQKTPLPFLTIISKNNNINIKQLKIVNEGKEFIFEGIKLKGAFNLTKNNLSFKKAIIEVKEAFHKKNLSFGGELTLKNFKELTVKGDLNYGRCCGKVKLDYSYEEKKCNFNFFDFVVFPSDFKDSLYGSAFTINGKLKIEKEILKGDLTITEKDFGNLKIKGEGFLSNNILKSKLKVSTHPFFFTLKTDSVKDPSFRLNSELEGTLIYDLLSGELTVDFKGTIKNSTVFGIDLANSLIELKYDKNSLKIKSIMNSQIVGKGNLEIFYDFSQETTYITFDNERIMAFNLLEKLGINISLPQPFSLSKEYFKSRYSELKIDNETSIIDLKLLDENQRNLDIFVFYEKGEIKNLRIKGDIIDLKKWGLNENLYFSGELFFDYEKRLNNIIPIKLTNVRVDYLDYHFEIDGEEVLLENENILSFDQLKVKSQFLSCVLKGHIKDDGNLFINGVILKGDLKNLNMEGLRGDLSGIFEISGNFSLLVSHFDLSSLEISYEGFTLKNNTINGFFEFDGKLKNLSLSLSSKKADFYEDISELKFHLEKREKNGTFLSSFETSSYKSIRLKGEIHFEEDYTEVNLASLIMEGKRKNLYLINNPSIYLGKNSVKIENVALGSGDSLIEFDGKINKEFYSFNIKFNNFSLTLFPLLGDIEHLSGRIDGEMSFKKDLKKYKIDGDIYLKNLSYSPIETTLKYFGFLHFEIKENLLNVSSSYFTTNEGGECSLSGMIDLSKFPFEPNLVLKGEDFPVEYKKMVEGMFDFDFKLKRNSTQLELTGNIDVLKGKIKTLSLSNRELPQSITFIDFPKSESNETFLKKITNSLKGEIKVSVKDKVWFLHKDILAKLKGTINLSFKEKEIKSAGKLSVSEGRLLISGVKFDIKDSYLYFSPDMGIYPALDIKGEKEMGNYTAQIRIQGNIEKPTISFSSTPPLEESEILSLILFGRPTRDLTLEESTKWGGTVMMLALNYKASPFIESLSKKLKFDTLEISSSIEGEPQLGFSKFLNDRLILEYKQTFGSLPESNFILKYRLNNTLSIETNSSNQGKSGIDLIWEQKY